MPLLATRFYVPSIPNGLIPRPRLINQLNQAANYRLTLISAPAGFGKTTLAVEWRKLYPDYELAWLSLDETDNEPVRFLNYLVGSLKNFVPEICKDILALLNTPQPLSIESALTLLINSIAEFIAQQKIDNLFLVLDDYHVIDHKLVHTALTFLIERMPPEMHLIITSRVDPMLPLHRLRARGQLLEIRSTDLRFNLSETTLFLEQNTKRKLEPALIDQLSTRVEGWAVGLQLASLWLRNSQNGDNVLNSFSGSNRFVLEYLAEEVLNRQPEPLRTFLLETSLLDRFNDELAGFVTGIEDSSEIVSRLEQANLFLVSLDNNENWYRYHLLFAEFLRHRLKREKPERIVELQLRASEWFERQGLLYEAIEYSLAARDFAAVARLIDQAARSVTNEADYYLLERWISRIPEEFILHYPEICRMHVINELLFKGVETGLEKFLDAIEMQVRAKNDLNRLGFAFYLRAQFARCKNDLAATIEYSEQALTLLNQDELQTRSMVFIAMAVVYLNNGVVDKALAVASEALVLARRSNSQINQLYTFLLLGDLYTLQGNLPTAIKNYKEVIKFAPQALPSPILAYLRLANIYLERNELELAEKYLKIGEEFVNSGGLNYVPLGNGVYGGLWWPQSYEVAGLQIYPAKINPYPPRERVIAQLEALKTRFNSFSPDPLKSEEWSHTRFGKNYKLLKPFDYQHEPEYLTLARVLIYQQKFAEAQALLTDLRHEAEAQNRQHSLIKILLLLALVAYSREKTVVVAGKLLQEALVLAESGGYIKVFIEEGKLLKQLLVQTLPLLGPTTDYAYKLLAVFPAERPEPSVRQAEIEPGGVAESLTERELEVLYLLGEGASNQEIADRLVVTLSTVKKHLANIFDKLNSTNRTQVIIRARELGLL
jgi:LuxR family maltose regulon positive regulatory protein